MNLKAIIVGGLVATILSFSLLMLAIGLGVMWTEWHMTHNDGRLALIIFLVSMLIGAAIAGVMSINKSNSWKNGACALALMEILYMVVIIPVTSREPFIDNIVIFIVLTPISLLIGAFGGFLGGKIKK